MLRPASRKSSRSHDGASSERPHDVANGAATWRDVDLSVWVGWVGRFVGLGGWSSGDEWSGWVDEVWVVTGAARVGLSVGIGG